MKVLVIGGSRFLGRAIVEMALKANHEVTAFNRGRTWPAKFSDVELIVGHRDTDLHLLGGRTWDAVIDTCGYGPTQVSKSASALVERVGRYLFVSTVSVYPWPMPPGVVEDADVASLPDGLSPDGGEPEGYGARKALCEVAVRKVFGNRSLAIRPGMIVGPHDYTERFDYWVKRAARGGEMLVPGRPERALQLIDVDDLANWLIHVAQHDVSGVVNVTGPVDGRLTWGDFIATCILGTNGHSAVRWIDEPTLKKVALTPGFELPWWTSENENGIFEADIFRALSLGLATRPLVETVRRTYAYLRSTDNLDTNCLTKEREEEILSQVLAESR